MNLINVNVIVLIFLIYCRLWQCRWNDPCMSKFSTNPIIPEPEEGMCSNKEIQGTEKKSFEVPDNSNPICFVCLNN